MEFTNKLMYRIKVLRDSIEEVLVLDDINKIKKILSNSLEDVPTTLNKKWQKVKDKNKYSEFETKTMLVKLRHDILINGDVDLEEWFNQFKNK